MIRPMVILGACVLLASPLAAASDAEAAGTDERAEAVLNGAAEYLAEQDTYSFGASLVYEGHFGGETEVFPTEYEVAFRRPGDIYVHAANADIEIEFRSDGTHYIRYISEFAQYVKEEEAMSPSEVVATSGFDVIESTLRVLSELMRERPFADSDTRAALRYIGEEPWNGFDTHHIQLTYAGTNCDLWIEKGDRPLIRRVAPDMSALEAAFEQRAGVPFEIDVAAEITTWDLGADVDHLLAFSPPEGTEEVSDFHPPQPESEAKKMAGSIAPDFSMALLDSGTLKLSEKRGQIIILDFWATWCGPCRIAMPVLNRVSKEFAAQNVHLYGVNLQESPERIKAFLDSEGLDVTVALDTDGSVANLYRVTGIPQTVIIDGEGKVAVVHVGLWATPPTDLGADATQDAFLEKMDEALAEALREELRTLTGQAISSD